MNYETCCYSHIHQKRAKQFNWFLGIKKTIDEIKTDQINNSFSIYCQSEENFKLIKQENEAYTYGFFKLREREVCVDVTPCSDINFMEEKKQKHHELGFIFCEWSLTLST